MARFISASETVAMLADSQEIAFLDSREIAPFGAGQPLLATNLPLSRMELSIQKLVPRRTTRMVLTDGGDATAALAAERLERLGYSNIAVLEGGIPAWAAASFKLFPELEVPTKGFGAFARRFGRPTFITPRELDLWPVPIFPIQIVVVLMGYRFASSLAHAHEFHKGSSVVKAGYSLEGRLSRRTVSSCSRS